MLNISQKQNCNGCTACLAICPQKCITMQEDHEGFLYPKVNLQICNDCGLCTKVCPIINKVKASNNPVAFAAINKNEEIRLQSSSGGIFSLLAEFTIENGGTVFGAAFDRNFILTHKSTNSFEGLSKFRGSKFETI